MGSLAVVKWNDDDWFQCPTCRILVNSASHFLIHLEGHDKKEKCAIGLFHLPNGQNLGISELQGDPQIFLPRIHLSSVTDTFENSKLSISSNFPTINLSTMTAQEINKIRQELSKSDDPNNPAELSDHHRVASDEFENVQDKICKTPNRCGTCNSIFSSPRNLRRHKRNIHKEILRPRNFNDVVPSDEFQKGQDEISKKPTCGTCYSTFSSAKNLRRHERNIHGQMIRPRKFNSSVKQPAEFELLKPSSSGRYLCPICGKEFRFKSTTVVHILNHRRAEERYNSKPVKCRICKIGFSRQEHLLRHFTKHISNNPFKCTICQLQTTSKYELQQHWSRHYEGTKLKCGFCGKELGCAKYLKRHIRKHHPDSRTDQSENTKFQQKIQSGKQSTPHSASRGSITTDLNGKVKCEDDDTNANPLSALPSENNNHDWRLELREKIKEMDPNITLHTPNTSRGITNFYNCKFCESNSFTRAYLLQTHMKTYHPAEYQNEIKKHELGLLCSECGFSCSSEEELSNHHRLAHPSNSKRKFVCGLCKYRFISQLSLDEHKKSIHENPQTDKYQCPSCPKSFITITRLRRHHGLYCNPANKSAEKFVCPHCGKRLSYQKTFNRHLRLHSKDRKFSFCRLCNEKCSSPIILKQHVQRVHTNHR